MPLTRLRRRSCSLSLKLSALAIESVCAIDSVVVISTVFGLEGITLLAYLVRSLSSSPLRGAKALTHPDSILLKLTPGERLLAFGQLFPRSVSEDVAQFVRKVLVSFS